MTAFVQTRGRLLFERNTLGRTHRLTLVSASLGEVSGWLAEVRRGWEASLDRLDAALRLDAVPRSTDDRDR